MDGGVGEDVIGEDFEYVRSKSPDIFMLVFRDRERTIQDISRREGAGSNQARGLIT